MKTGLVFLAAALAEIGGCFAFWAWLRLGKTFLWLLPGCASLLLFAYLLTLVDTSVAGRAYAAFGGMYITLAVFWMLLLAGIPPARWVLSGRLLFPSHAAHSLPWVALVGPPPL